MPPNVEGRRGTGVASYTFLLKSSDGFSLATAKR